LNFQHTNDQLNELKENYSKKLNLVYPLLPLSNMMETETWTHPTHTNISNRIELWRQSIYKLSNRYKMEQDNISSEGDEKKLVEVRDDMDEEVIQSTTNG